MTMLLFVGVLLSALSWRGSALVPPSTSTSRTRRLDTNISTSSSIVPKAATSSSSSSGGVPSAPPGVIAKGSIPPFATWKRRLNTKQDPYSIHKLAGFGWWLSSTAIFTAGATNGFTELPQSLEPVTYVFLFSTLAQSMSSIPMALKYRSDEPVARRGFISSAITTTSLAFTGFWLSPFAAQDHVQPPIAAALIALLVTADALYSMTSFQDMKQVAAKITKQDKAAAAKTTAASAKAAMKNQELYTTLVAMAPVGLPMNALLLYNMLGHFDSVRDYFLSVIMGNGSTPELVYYALVVTSISASVGNLAATLYHRKLISKDVENLATIGAFFVTVVFNIRAAPGFFT